jgi:hypothetical protein
MVRGTQPIVVTFRTGDPLLAPAMPVTELATVIATRVAPVHTVPVARACGRYVDWYRPRGPSQ